MAEFYDRLMAPFDPARVSWRLGRVIDKDGKKRGMALAYLDARDVMERLDDVVGPEHWQNDYPHATGKTVCRIGIKVHGEWVWKSDGAGDTDVEAEKGALSDAFKRAAVRWGIGRYLYDLDSPWVDVDQFGKTSVIAKHEAVRLEEVLRRYKVPVRPMTVDHMLYEIETAAGDPEELGALKAQEAFRVGYRNASKADQAKILKALNPAEGSVA